MAAFVCTPSPSFSDSELYYELNYAINYAMVANNIPSGNS